MVDGGGDEGGEFMDQTYVFAYSILSLHTIGNLGTLQASGACQTPRLRLKNWMWWE